MYVNDDLYAEMVKSIRDLTSEVVELRQIRKDAQLLIAGAMRQGYVNGTQKEALLYAFRALTGEQDETILLLIVDVHPRGFGLKITEAKAPETPPEPPQKPAYDSGENWSDWPGWLPPRGEEWR